MTHASLTSAIEETRELNAWDRAQAARQETQRQLRAIRCPDCGAELRLETAGELPEDLKVVFVRHCV